MRILVCFSGDTEVQAVSIVLLQDKGAIVANE